MKKIITASLLTSTLLLTSSIANAAASDFASTGKMGTLGAGLDITYGINSKLNTRINFNGGKLNADDQNDGIHYKGDLKAQTVGGLLDFYPAGGAFRLTAGLYNNANKLDLVTSGASNNNVFVGDRAYDLSKARLDANVKFKSTAPYLGLGWGNPVSKGSKWNFSFDAGVLFQGAPEATLKGSGQAKDIATGLALNLATDPTFQSELSKEEKNLNNDLKDFKAYPVVSLGASYRF